LLRRCTSPELQRIERCWVRLLLIVVIVGSVAAAGGIRGSVSGLAEFLAVLGVLAMPLIARGLRPPVRLSSSTNRGERVRSS
jgi:hypothetical protein